MKGQKLEVLKCDKSSACGIKLAENLSCQRVKLSMQCYTQFLKLEMSILLSDNSGYCLRVVNSGPHWHSCRPWSSLYGFVIFKCFVC